MRQSIARILRLVHSWLWAKVQSLVWSTHASRDQLDQIIWRLEMNQRSVDAQAALVLAKQLRRRVYGN